MKLKQTLHIGCAMLAAGLPLASWGHAGHKHADVEWPAVRSLDAVSAEVRYAVEQGDVAGLRGQVPRVIATVKTLRAGSIPKKVRKPLMVQFGVDGLVSFSQSLAKKGATMNDSALVAQMKRFSPMVDELIDVSQAAVVQGHGPHDGEFGPVLNEKGAAIARVELKLHDDKGDLELWVTSADGKSPVDLPLGAKIGVDFLDKEGRKVVLQVRNSVRNEDEDGMPNIRDGKTNYFIFPGDTGADATWLMGKSFKTMVRISLEVEGQAVQTIPFHLSPHGGADHSH